MSLFEMLWIGHRNDRRGLRLPLLLGRLHLGLIFSGPSSTSGRKSSDNSSLRSFLFIAAILITKCGSSSFPNTSKIFHGNNISSTSGISASSVTPSLVSTRKLDEDYQDFPLDHHLFRNLNSKSINHQHADEQYFGESESSQHVKTLGYFLKGLILPMLISLTLSFGFIIYKNRLKRARLQAIQNSLEEARANPNQVQHYRRDGLLNPGENGLVSNALLSFIDARGEWSLVSGNEGLLLEADDYIGEGGETARHKPYLHDLPPDYAAVFDPPSYEEATTIHKMKASTSKPTKNNELDDQVVSSISANSTDMVANSCDIEDDDDDDEKHLMSSGFHREQ